MYVCVCNAITEKRLRDAASSTPHRSVKHAYRTLGCTIDCGQCLRVANDVVSHARRSAAHAIAAE